jgi:hypothetical protein
LFRAPVTPNRRIDTANRTCKSEHNHEQILKRAAWPDTGDYTVAVRNSFGETVSLPARLDILDPSQLPPEIISPPVSQTVLTGAGVSFRVRASGTHPLTYQWHFNDRELPGATEPLLRIDNARPEHAGTYHVVVQNHLGGTFSRGATLNVLYQDKWPRPGPPGDPIRFVPGRSPAAGR